MAPPSASALTCFRVGTGFDWHGDVAVAVDAPSPASEQSSRSLYEMPEPPARLSQNLLAAPPRIAQCGRVREGHNLTLGCAGGHTIDKVVFASFGTTVGNCTQGFAPGNCSTTGKIGSASTSMAVVEKACIGNPTCVVPATVPNFAPGGGHGSNPCPRVVKSLAAQVHCSGGGEHACRQSCYDDTNTPGPAPPGPPPPDSTTTPADRFNAVVNATRSTAIGNYVMDIPTDSPQVH